jgi:integrase/recombinase XerD
LPAKLTTTVNNIDAKVKNQVNRDLIKQFYSYLKNIDTSDNYQNGLLKVIIRYVEHLGQETTFYQIQDKEQIIKYLDSKRKMIEEDPDKKWIITWNDYLWRLKYFYRWLYNAKEKGLNANII